MNFGCVSNELLGLVGRALGWEVGGIVLWDLVQTIKHLQN